MVIELASTISAKADEPLFDVELVARAAVAQAPGRARPGARSRARSARARRSTGPRPTRSSPPRPCPRWSRLLSETIVPVAGAYSLVLARVCSAVRRLASALSIDAWAEARLAGDGVVGVDRGRRRGSGGGGARNPWNRSRGRGRGGRRAGRGGRARARAWVLGLGLVLGLGGVVVGVVVFVVPRRTRGRSGRRSSRRRWRSAACSPPRCRRCSSPFSSAVSWSWAAVSCSWAWSTVSCAGGRVQRGHELALDDVLALVHVDVGDGAAWSGS